MAQKDGDTAGDAAEVLTRARGCDEPLLLPPFAVEAVLSGDQGRGRGAWGTRGGTHGTRRAEDTGGRRASCRGGARDRERC